MTPSMQAMQESDADDGFISLETHGRSLSLVPDESASLEDMFDDGDDSQEEEAADILVDDPDLMRQGRMTLRATLSTGGLLCALRTAADMRGGADMLFDSGERLPLPSWSIPPMLKFVEHRNNSLRGQEKSDFQAKLSRQKDFAERMLRALEDLKSQGQIACDWTEDRENGESLAPRIAFAKDTKRHDMLVKAMREGHSPKEACVIANVTQNCLYAALRRAQSPNAPAPSKALHDRLKPLLDAYDAREAERLLIRRTGDALISIEKNKGGMSMREAIRGTSNNMDSIRRLAELGQAEDANESLRAIAEHMETFGRKRSGWSDPKRREKIIELLTNGYSLSTACKMSGISTTPLKRLLNLSGTGELDEEESAYCRRVKQGMEDGKSKVAEVRSRTRWRVMHRLRDRNFTQEDGRLMVHLLQQGFSPADACREIGVHATLYAGRMRTGLRPGAPQHAVDFRSRMLAAVAHGKSSKSTLPAATMQAITQRLQEGCALPAACLAEGVSAMGLKVLRSRRKAHACTPDVDRFMERHEALINDFLDAPTPKGDADASIALQAVIDRLRKGDGMTAACEGAGLMPKALEGMREQVKRGRLGLVPHQLIVAMDRLTQRPADAEQMEAALEPAAPEDPWSAMIRHLQAGMSIKESCRKAEVCMHKLNRMRAGMRNGGSVPEDMADVVARVDSLVAKRLGKPLQDQPTLRRRLLDLLQGGMPVKRASESAGMGWGIVRGFLRSIQEAGACRWRTCGLRRASAGIIPCIMGRLALKANFSQRTDVL